MTEQTQPNEDNSRLEKVIDILLTSGNVKLAQGFLIEQFANFKGTLAGILPKESLDDFVEGSTEDYNGFVSRFSANIYSVPPGSQQTFIRAAEAIAQAINPGVSFKVDLIIKTNELAEHKRGTDPGEYEKCIKFARMLAAESGISYGLENITEVLESGDIVSARRIVIEELANSEGTSLSKFPMEGLKDVVERGTKDYEGFISAVAYNIYNVSPDRQQPILDAAYTIAQMSKPDADVKADIVKGIYSVSNFQVNSGDYGGATDSIQFARKLAPEAGIETSQFESQLVEKAYDNAVSNKSPEKSIKFGRQLAVENNLTEYVEKFDALKPAS